MRRVITWARGVVVSVGRGWRGAQELTVRLDQAVAGLGPEVPALAYPDLVGSPAPGMRVLLNVTALARGLGTGGYALVVGLPDAPPAEVVDGPGHLVKARYTPLQSTVLGVDEQDSEHHALLRDADDLSGMPVVTADLHSALPAIVAGARMAAERAGRPAPRVVYLLTDGGALPAWFSRTLAALREAEWVHASVSVGQAFGGDLEAVTVHSGLLAAHLVCRADLVVAAQGPGNLGTGTRWGFSGVSAGEVVNAAGVLGGRPVASLRVSGADARPRHRGVSHHSRTAYGRVALRPADVVVPRFAVSGTGRYAELPEVGALIEAQVAELVAPHGRHRRVDVVADDALLGALRDVPGGLRTMGRGLDEDPAAFLAAAVAGVHAYALG